MSQQRDSGKKGPGESLGEMFEALANAIGEIFKDPELKERAREFGRSARESAETIAGRFQDEEVKAKFRDVGKAAEDLGSSIADHFKRDKDSREG